MIKHHLPKDQDGFTLIEIIAVLVILGILAAVAVPKFFDLQTKAKQKAVDGAVAELKSRVNQRFATLLLQGKSTITTTDYAAADVGTNLGDQFEVPAGTWIVTANEITFSITYKGDTATTNDDETFPGKTITLPKLGDAV